MNDMEMLVDRVQAVAAWLVEGAKFIEVVKIVPELHVNHCGTALCFTAVRMHVEVAGWPREVLAAVDANEDMLLCDGENNLGDLEPVGPLDTDLVLKQLLRQSVESLATRGREVSWLRESRHRAGAERDLARSCLFAVARNYERGLMDRIPGDIRATFSNYVPGKGQSLREMLAGDDVPEADLGLDDDEDKEVEHA